MARYLGPIKALVCPFRHCAAVIGCCSAMSQEARGLTPFPCLFIGPAGPQTAAGDRSIARRRLLGNLLKAGFFNVAALRTDRQGCAGWTQGESFEHQDQAAIPAQPAQRSSVPIPKFASLCGAPVCELRNRRTLATYRASVALVQKCAFRTRRMK